MEELLLSSIFPKQAPSQGSSWLIDGSATASITQNQLKIADAVESAKSFVSADAPAAESEVVILGYMFERRAFFTWRHCNENSITKSVDGMANNMA